MKHTDSPETEGQLLGVITTSQHPRQAKDQQALMGQLLQKDITQLLLQAAV